MFNSKFSKIFLTVFILGIFIFSAQPASASWFSIAEFTSGAISGLMEIVGYFFGYIAGIAMAIAGFLITFALNINSQIMTSLTVKTGWQIVLNLANLGFVLAIIIIAFSTIFRFEGYQMKQILWKLVVAALLVNFSLVIAGAFIDTAKVFTDFFMEQGGINSPGEWSEAFAGMFKAQALTNVSEKFVKESGAGGGAALNAFGEQALLTVSSLFFIVIFTIFATITMLAVAIMLFIRYIYLGILLILSPIVWLLWIFPGTKSYWSKWWNQFIRWTFFAPAMMFFIYLALYTMKNQSTINTAIKSSGAENVKVTFGAEIIGEMAIVIGLVIGGLMAANSLGIAGASTAMGLAKKAGTGFGGWVGKKSLQGATYPFRRKGAKEGAESLAEKSQKWASGIKNPVGRFAAGLIAKGTVNLAEKGGGQVKDAESQIKNMSKEQAKAALLATVSRTRKIALLKKLTDEKALGEIDMARYANDDTKKLFNSYGQGKAFGDMEKSSISVEMLNAIKNKDGSASLKASEDFVAKLTKGDIDRSALKDIFSGKLKLGFNENEMKALKESFARAISTVNPTLVANIVPKLDSRARNNFEETYSSVISDSPKIKENFEKLMMKYTEGPALESEGLGESVKTEEPTKKEV